MWPFSRFVRLESKVREMETRLHELERVLTLIQTPPHSQKPTAWKHPPNIERALEERWERGRPSAASRAVRGRGDGGTGRS